ncbi:GLIPR1-like protein 1 precursor [Schistosoma japonicum]|uniref:GLIPR1-like protein 1 n=1 Tax=Schistosoma japonicum TaxID=6182 RepID=C1LN94_SCHJA|nr:GLIPR1-like protein 1 precursor [Schistosoma japonicum]CAX76172.1 GLIPR1-like protein 1 precursor [Schistosoma japonicum]CAX76174.1 GLIPR1-like protein 1 precursor [Schistosoma japonicum]
MHPISKSSIKALLSICLLVCTYVHAWKDNKSPSRLLALHNNVRKSVVNGELAGQPMAVSLKSLKWDKNLAKSAQILAKKCSFTHDNVTNRSTSSFAYVGQNIAGANNVDIGFGLWLNENKYYEFFNRSCLVGKCNQYTQIVSQNTTHIGCGVATCKNSPFKMSIVCNYGPGGNHTSEFPYRAKGIDKPVTPMLPKPEHHEPPTVNKSLPSLLKAPKLKSST